MNEAGLRELMRCFGISKEPKRASGNLIFPCPFAPYTHSDGKDSHPSFTIEINPSGQSVWRCFACEQKGGTAISLLYRFKDLGAPWNSQAYKVVKAHETESLGSKLSKLDDFETQKRKNHSKQSYNLSWDDPSYEASFNIKDFADILSEVPQYAIDRGITPDQAYRWKIGYHKELGRLFFAILDHTHKMVGWSGRAIFVDQEPKYYHAPYFKRNKYLYGEWRVSRMRRRGYLMEGFMDVLNLDRLGLKNCLGTMGTEPSEQQIDSLVEWFDEIIIFPHDDKPDAKGVSPGMRMAESYKKSLEERGVKVKIGPIVPHQRKFVDPFGKVEIRNPKDPGEWSLENLQWVFEILRGKNESPSEQTAPQKSSTEAIEQAKNECDSDFRPGKTETGVDGEGRKEDCREGGTGLSAESIGLATDAPDDQSVSGFQQQYGSRDRNLPQGKGEGADP